MIDRSSGNVEVDRVWRRWRCIELRGQAARRGTHPPAPGDVQWHLRITTADKLSPRSRHPDARTIDLGTIDLGTVDLGTVDLGTVDLGTIDLGTFEPRSADPRTIAGRRPAERCCAPRCSAPLLLALRRMRR